MPVERYLGEKLHLLMGHCFGKRIDKLDLHSAAQPIHEPHKPIPLATPERALHGAPAEIRADTLCSAEVFSDQRDTTNEQGFDSSYVASSTTCVAALAAPSAQASVCRTSVSCALPNTGLYGYIMDPLYGVDPSHEPSQMKGAHQQPQPASCWAASPRLLEMRAQVSQLQLLSRGGQAVVLRGVWQLADVAVKLVVANPASTPASIFSKLMLEGALSKRLRAPNVVETYCYSSTRLTLEGFQACHAADETPDPGNSTSCVGLEGTDDRVLGSELNQHLQGLVQQQKYWYMNGAGGAGGIGNHSRYSFDSLDGFGSPSARRSTVAVMTYSEALSSVGATPGCFLTQIIMELCDQGSLADVVAKGAYAKAAHDRMALFAYLRTLYDIAAGMSYLHSNGVIHGDLKPGNVLLRSSRADLRGYQVKVADFGLSHCISSTDASFQNNDADWSSHPYMAPEHFDGRLVMSSDVWSFAATAHHMWTGQLPHSGLHPLQVCVGVCDGSLRLEAPAGMPPQLWRLLRTCMTKQWKRRPTFPQIRAVLRHLEDAWFGS